MSEQISEPVSKQKITLTLGTLGPEQSHAWQAATQYAPQAEITLYPHLSGLVNAFITQKVDQIVLPIFNTRQGENKQYFRLFEQIKRGYWLDNVVLPTNLSLGVFAPDMRIQEIEVLLGRRAVFRQCEDYIYKTFPDAALTSVQDMEQAVRRIQEQGLRNHGVIATAELLDALGLHTVEREVAPHNRTRYAVLGRELSRTTGYDATAFITEPLDDRVGLLVDILGEFSRHGINILDISSENDVKTQKLQIYLEAEGHINDTTLQEAVTCIEERVIGQRNRLRLLGCFPRVDMRPKNIKSFGFIGTGPMSAWFADRLENEGYRIFMTGRTTERRPEQMIPEVDVVVVCVPISFTAETIRQYGPLLKDGQALIVLAGESETTLKTALEVTGSGVETMLVHNLWGPQAATMKDKNAIVVRTGRSGKFCSEFEAFLYKHGASMYQDSAAKHDLLMGIGQKLPTVISVALAMTLEENGITAEDLASHCTLTSLYPILAMARVHSQNPRTYAEIMSTSGESRKIVHDFNRYLGQVMSVADQGDQEGIEALCRIMEQNSQHLSESFLRNRMEQAKAVDEVLGAII
ncbi:MAG: prephenate dehydrogenase/arogenate dehydrogenase family protein [Candidatus Electrothrix sp. AU1_5]|nr:prephenate dehydrogenase/arogenate dehydrogenase family protein [Candidatus Electrothrix gigas]